MYIAPAIEVFRGNSYPMTSVLSSISSSLWGFESILQLIWDSIHQYCSQIARSQWITGSLIQQKEKKLRNWAEHYIQTSLTPFNLQKENKTFF